MFDVDAFVYSFTVTRHPYTRLISEYKFRSDIATRQNRNMAEINSWIEDVFKKYHSNNFVLDNHIRPQNEFLIPEMDVLRLEDGMESIFSRITKMTGIEEVTRAVHVNKSSGLNVSLSFEAKELIREFYSADFEAFDYEESSMQ